MSHKLTLQEKIHLCDNIWSFRFITNTPQRWIAGQYISVELPHDNPDGEGTKRWFTISSAPFEGFIEITTRITQSTFKQSLASLPIGSDALIMLDNPHGTFTWQNRNEPLVFVASGIGVTTFRSILRQRWHDNLPLNVHLIYGNRRADAIAFKEELDKYASKDSSFKLQYVIGERFTATKLAALEPNLNRSVVYLSGPGSMVKLLGMQLEAAGLADIQLKVDAFPSYTDQTY